MKAAIAKVREFHHLAALPNNDVPTIPGAVESEMLQELLDEECLELCAALGALTRAQQADNGQTPDSKDRFANVVKETCDVLYSALGIIVALGIPPDKFVACWEAVCVSNTAKTDDLTVAANGKILKPEGWTPPDLHSILWGGAA